MPPRLNTESWIARARAVHDDRYDYSESVYTLATEPIRIICSAHGPFEQIARNHVNNKAGCPDCGHERTGAASRWSIEGFITRARQVHGDTYDYSKVAYVNQDTPVTIVCPKHGLFEQRAGEHLKHGCRTCGIESRSKKRRLPKDEFIARAREVHGDKYDYSDVVYAGLLKPVTIICPTHGAFEQNASNHVNLGHGCSRCSDRYSPSTEEFIARVREVHGDTYDYSLAVYTDSSTKVTIICPRHGAFEKRPIHHAAGGGCTPCAIEARGLSSRKTKAEWLAQAYEVHGDTYDYSKVEFELGGDRVTIICSKHGEFEQVASVHVNNHGGCPSCKWSKGENATAAALEDLGIMHITQWTHETCRDKRLLRFDFYLPEYGALIEFDGAQHFKPVRWPGMKPEDAKRVFLGTQRRDRIKNDWAKANGYALLRVSDINAIETEVLAFVAGLHNTEEEGEVA